MRTVIRKRYTAEFKAQAVELVKVGRPVRAVAEELEVGVSLLYGWVQKAVPLVRGEAGAIGDMPSADEWRRLRREIAQLKLENDILKKAAVLLGTNPPRNDEL